MVETESSRDPLLLASGFVRLVGETTPEPCECSAYVRFHGASHTGGYGKRLAESSLEVKQLWLCRSNKLARRHFGDEVSA